MSEQREIENEWLKHKFRDEMITDETECFYLVHHHGTFSFFIFHLGFPLISHLTSYFTSPNQPDLLGPARPGPTAPRTEPLPALKGTSEEDYQNQALSKGGRK